MKLDSQILSYSSSKLSKKSEYSEEGVRNKDKNTIDMDREQLVEYFKTKERFESQRERMLYEDKNRAMKSERKK